MTEVDRSRLRRDQLKALVLDAGVELLLEDGLGAKTVPLGYADAFRWLREHRSLTVSRAQVHRRIWNSLTEYRNEVMANMVRSGWPGEVYDVTAQEVHNAVESLDIADTDAPTRLKILCDLARRMTDENAADSRRLRSIAAADALFAMHALGRTDRPSSPSVRQAIIQNRTAILDRYIELYKDVGETFGFVAGSGWGLKPDDGMRMYAEILSCVNQGAAGRSSYEPSLQELKIGDELWSVEGLCVYAVTEHVASQSEARAQTEEECVVEPHLVTNGNKMDGFDQLDNEKDSPATSGSRMERDTLRQEMIDAGAAVLLEKGFGHGAEQITYSRVFARVKEQRDITVARAQVHRRIWQSQNHFQLELLATAARPNEIGGLEQAAEAATNAMQGVKLTSPALVRSAAAEVVRAATMATAEELARSGEWRLGRAIMAFHALNRTRSETVGESLHQEYEAGIASWAKLMESLALTLGYRPRPWTKCSLEEVCVTAARCADVLSDGVVARARMLGEASNYRVSIDDHEPQDWNILGIGTWCVIDFLTEPKD